MGTITNRLLSLAPYLFAFALLCSFVPGVHAFGAGNIPSFSYLEGKAFRHGDIEDILAEVAKKTGGMFGRKTFSSLDIKRIYFGNWLRDYSQAMDIAGLSKLPKQTILNLIMALGFMAHGYATGEFEVTEERLGVYQTTEHIDNPKGYAADQPGGDARHVDPRLRPPVDPRELEVDPRTGIKNYIANENGSWDTSTALIRRLVCQCIEHGRRAKATGSDADEHEAFRLMGTFLHTLEDFPAHSNWCELSLKRMGFHQVFCHVGDRATVQSPAGPAPPLTTGSFGGADFIHSLLGEASDHLAEASVSDLQKAMDNARGSSSRGIGDDGVFDTLRSLMNQMPDSSGLSREMRDVEDIRQRASSGQASGAQMSPQELHATLWKVLTFRDNVAKSISATIEKIPGLSSLVEKLQDAIARFVYTTLEPLLKPVMGQATQVLSQGSAQVINQADQYEVFDKPYATDPTHSFLSKDHFALVLNEVAGKVAIVILRHSVNLVVKAWEDSSLDPVQTANTILEAIHHPYFYNDRSQIQRDMGHCIKDWIDSQHGEDKRYILNALTKESVRAHKNRRKGQLEVGHGAGGKYNSPLSPEKVTAFASANIPGASSVIGTFNQLSGYANQAQNYIGRDMPSDNPSSSYGHQQSYNAPPPPQHSYNAPPPQHSYNVPPPQHSYNAPPPQHSYNAPPQHDSYGSQQHGYGGGGFHSGPPQQQHGGYGGPPGGFHGGPPPPGPGGFHAGPPGGYNPGYQQQQHHQPPHHGGQSGYPGSHHGGQSGYPGSHHSGGGYY